MRIVTAQRLPLPIPSIEAYIIWNLICNNKISCGSAVVARRRDHTRGHLSTRPTHTSTTPPQYHANESACQLPVVAGPPFTVYKKYFIRYCVFSIGAYPEHCFFFCIIIILHALVVVRQSVATPAGRLVIPAFLANSGLPWKSLNIKL